MQDYEQIALECDKLEASVCVGLEELGSTHKLLGKSWYSIGLENNDDDKQHDSSNKRNILLRIIDKIVAFIKMIGAKIAEWYHKCKAAILRFFGKEQIDPRNVSKRFDLLVKSIAPKDIDAIIASTSELDKRTFAEILDINYNKAFKDVYSEYKQIKDKIHSADQFAEHYHFFAEFKTKAGELRDIAQKNKIYENMDESFKKLLHGQGNSGNVEELSSDFNEINATYTGNAAQLEKLLKEIPNHDFAKIEGSDPDTKRQNVVRLVSDVIKVDGEIVLRVNHRMAAVTTLMRKIVRGNYKKLNIIPH